MPLCARKTHSSIQEQWDVVLASDSSGKKKCFAVFLQLQCESEISSKEKNLVRKTRAKYMSDLPSRGGDDSKEDIFLQTQQILEKSLSGASIKLPTVFSQSGHHDWIKSTHQSRYPSSHQGQCNQATIISMRSLEASFPGEDEE